MRRTGGWGLVVVGLVLAALLPVQVVTAAGPSGVVSTVTLRLAPPVVTWHEARSTADPTGLVAQVSPVRRRATLVFQEQVGTAWTTLATLLSDARGRAYLPLDVSGTGSRSFRVVQPAQAWYRASTSRTAGLTVLANTACSPATEPVDPEATGEVYCLAARLDRWRSAGLMGIGQQLNVSNKDYLAPLSGLSRVSVVGFDLEELSLGETYSFATPPVQGLMDLAGAGAVLTATWHATNPFTGGPFNDPDRGGRPLSDVLHESTDAGAAFWADFDAKLALLERFEVGDPEGDGAPLGTQRTAIVFRPLHEANGDFFWWGKPGSAVFRQLWSAMQARAAGSGDDGVHNLLWAYSFNLHTTGVADPASLVPLELDLAGLDSYDPEYTRTEAPDRLALDGYSAVAAKANVPRMALTEVGPHGSRDGSWNPAVITRSVRTARISPLWAMLWFDDGTPSVSNRFVGRKQISSLDGGRSWLASCPNALCYLR